MKLAKVHIALLTNVTEGKVKNEHITMRYWKEVNANTVWERMRELNLRLPVDLFHNAIMNAPYVFRSWNGDEVTCVNFRPAPLGELDRDPEFVGLFKGVSLPHITLAKNQTRQGYQNLKYSYQHFNWEEGLKIGECHVGWKENGEMVYRTESELIDWIANNA